MCWRTAARLTFGLFLIAALLYRFDPAAVLSTILSASPLLLLAPAVYSITFLILSLRWRRILHALGEDLPLSDAYQAFAGGMILSDLTPGRIGDLSRSLLVRDKVALNKGLASVLIDRYADILTIFALGLCGMLFLAQRGPYILLASSVILMILASTSLIWLRRSSVLRMLRSRSSRFTGIANAFEDATCDLRGVNGLMTGSVLMTILAWITHALRIVIIARSVGYDIPLIVLIFGLPLVSALSLIPVTVSGLGLVEGGLAVLLAGAGVPAAVGVSIALMDRAITVAFHILVGARAAARAL
ncbi:MAG: lysylphosphatidylglycerol synthase transmembrane domain-containing protein [Methanothrix sp.]